MLLKLVFILSTCVLMYVYVYYAFVSFSVISPSHFVPLHSMSLCFLVLCLLLKVMEGTPIPQTPQPSPALGTPPPSQRFQVGDTVQIFQGTGPGVPGKKTIQFIGTVVGYNNDKG